MHSKFSLFRFLQHTFTPSKVQLDVTDRTNLNLTVHMPKMTLKQLNKKELKIYRNLNSENYGEDLSLQVAEKLTKASARNGLYFAHRDYCGLGIFYQENTYVLGTVYDGYGITDPIITFNSKEAFVTWLASENDKNMALYGEKFNNQTITKSRINWFLDPNYSPVWNDYCMYLKAQSH